MKSYFHFEGVRVFFPQTLGCAAQAGRPVGVLCSGQEVYLRLLKGTLKVTAPMAHNLCHRQLLGLTFVLDSKSTSKSFSKSARHFWREPVKSDTTEWSQCSGITNIYTEYNPQTNINANNDRDIIT